MTDLVCHRLDRRLDAKLNVAPLPTGRAKIGRGVLLEKVYTTRFLLAASRARVAERSDDLERCRIR